MAKRMIRESPLPQGEDESITYELTTTPWGSTPTNVSIVVFDVTNADETSDWTDVTNTVMPINDPDVVGDVITFSPLKNIIDAHVYRMEIGFTVAIGDVETYCIIFGGE